MPARELLAKRIKANYNVVEALAQKHKSDPIASLSWLALGQAHSLDGDWKKASDAFERAQKNSGELKDYADALLALSQQAQNDSSAVRNTLADFDRSFPKSIFNRDMSVVLANALTESGETEPAAALLSVHRMPVRNDIELALARVWIAKPSTADQGIEALRKLYFEQPLSAESQTAAQLLRGAGRLEDAPGFPRYRARIAALIAGKHFAEAESDLHDLLRTSSTQDKSLLMLLVALAQFRDNKLNAARKTLESVPSLTDGIDASALRQFLVAELARADHDDQGASDAIDALRSIAPTHAWFREALFNSGNSFLIHQDLPHAEERYRELANRFPAASNAATIHWKAAWLSYRLGNKEEAARRFEEQVRLYPNSAEAPSALYWRARLYGQQGYSVASFALLAKISDRYRNYYYAELARNDLRALHATNGPVELPAEVQSLLDAVPPVPASQSFTASLQGVDDVHLRKARLLASASLTDFAVKELQAAAAEGNASWSLAETARILLTAGRIHTALQTVKRAIPNYSQWDFNAFPRELWEDLFPRSYWPSLTQNSNANGLDPALVASLIRQESEFNPGAVSHANAHGLMQLLPTVGKQLARQVKLKGFNTRRLLEPDVNLKLGTRYFRQVLNATGGELVYALAAYNAGENRVVDWRAAGPNLDTSEFVESIPFTETRDYVQAILRNQAIYKKLYGSGVSVALNSTR